MYNVLKCCKFTKMDISLYQNGSFLGKQIGLNLGNVVSCYKLEFVFFLLGVYYNLLDKRVSGPGL